MKARMILGKGLNKEFNEYKQNIFETEKTIQAYVFWKQIELDGTWLTPNEIKQKASILLQGMLNVRFIQNGKIVPGILECINETIRR